MRLPASCNPRARPSRRGATLLELAIGATLIATMLAALALSQERATRAYDTGRERLELEERAHRVLDRIAAEFDEAERETLGPEPDPVLGGEFLNYRRSEGFGEGGIEWGEMTRIAYEREPGELDDGLDNDGDGLVDEARVVWTLDPDGIAPQQVTWCGGVRELLGGELANGLDDNGNGLIDEPGLTFELGGNLLTIRLTVEGLDAEGRLLSETVQTAVVVRN